MEVKPKPYQGGARLLRFGAIAGVVGLVITGVSMVMAPRRTLFAYLTAYEWAMSLVLGALIFVLVANVMKARWHTVIRRVPESIAATVPLLALLFIPIAIGVNQLYLWAAPPPDLDTHMQHLLEHKAAWLNVPGFLIRAVFYLVVWAVFALLLRTWSVRQDADRDPIWTLRSRWLSGAGIPALAITLTFAAFDWFMSLTPEWISAVYGVYVFAGGFQAAFALIILLVRRLETVGVLAGRVKPSHYHALGKLLFSFTIFWAYIAFSQYFIIWIGNLPEEVTWWMPRTAGWAAVSVFLVLARFAIPFFLMLPKNVKRNGSLSAGISAWILVMHWVDAYWLIMPTLNPEGPSPHIADLGALLFVGGVGSMALAWVMRRAAPVAEGDPSYAHSLRYSTF